MRLLHTTSLAFEEFFDDDVPPYAVWSHRWFKGQELSYDDFINGRKKQYSGYEKIVKLCELASAEPYRLEYAWIDTICIDKRSSAELSEAINSMFNWYKNSSVCFAYLYDVDSQKDDWETQFSNSEWFKRSWTLQELLAPRSITFFDKNFEALGTKRDLERPIAHITGIPLRYLTNKPLDLASVAQRMSWASIREASRVEDMAYSLLGIFGVNMPLLYGERERAFMRLQHQIIQQSDDESIFAWTQSVDEWSSAESMFAQSPAAFKHCGGIFDMAPTKRSRPPYVLTNKGLNLPIQLPQIWLPLDVKTGVVQNDRVAIVQLQCCRLEKGRPASRICIALVKIKDRELWARLPTDYHLMVNRTSSFDPVGPARLEFESVIVGMGRTASLGFRHRWPGTQSLFAQKWAENLEHGSYILDENKLSLAEDLNLTAIT